MLVKIVNMQTFYSHRSNKLLRRENVSLLIQKTRIQITESRKS